MADKFDFGEVMTELQTMANQMHEVYESFLQAGFTAKQALYLTGQMLKSGGENDNGSV